jgi:hypothetical protein
MAMNEKQAARWEKVRGKGKKTYVIWRGALVWGILAVIVLTLIEFLTQGTYDLNWMIIRFFVFALVGFLVNITLWEKKERKFAELSKSH